MNIGVDIGFWGLGALAVGAALGVVITNNLLHAVLFLILCFIALAGLFITLTADFIAVAQVLVYAGAVGVLIAFAIMLTPSGSRTNADTRYFGPGFIVGGLVATVMGFVAFRTPWAAVRETGFTTTVGPIGELLVGRWVLAFQLAGILLTVAMIAAIVLVRASESPEDLDDIDQPVPDITDDDRRGDRALVASGTEIDVSGP